MFKLVQSKGRRRDRDWPPKPRVIDPDRGYELKLERIAERGQVEHFSLYRENDGWDIKVRFQDFDQHGILIPGDLDYKKRMAYKLENGLRATTARVLVLYLRKVEIENGNPVQTYSETLEDIEAIFPVVKEAFLVYQRDHGEDTDCPVTEVKHAEPGEDEAYGYIEY